MRILLAEDDSSISTVTKIALEKIGGHSVVVAEDGRIALQKALTETFDLILLDGMMPGLDGLAVCREICSKNPTHPPIIFLSAKSQESDIREAVQTGAIGFIHKPFDPRTISSVIDETLKKAPGAVA